MGVMLTAKYPDAPQWFMGYLTFGRLRMDIAKQISPTFGELYSRGFTSLDDEKQYLLEMEMLGKLKPKKWAVEFLYLSDCSGKYSPYKCKILLEAIQDMDDTIRYGYGGWEKERQMAGADFKALLAECYSRKCYMIWS